MRTLLTRAGIFACAAAAPLLGLAACSGILGVESDRHVVTAATGDDAGTDWSCLGQPAPSGAGATVTVKFLLNDVTTSQSSTTFMGSPLAGASLHACNRLDFACDHPFLSATTDDGGVALAVVSTGFDGYFEVRANNFPPTILQRSPQRVDELALQGLTNTQLIALGGQIAHVTVDQSLGFAVLTAADCRNNPAPGVTFKLAAGDAASEALIYLENALPSGSATETDATGSAIIFNVPTGTLSVTATIAATGVTLRTMDAIARDGWATFLDMRADGTRPPAP